MNAPEVVVIRPRPGWRALDLADLWRRRDLVLHLAVRDIRVRYRQTLLGIAWTLLQPLALLAVFAGFFLARGGGHGEAVWATAAALVPWQVFAAAIAHVANSLVDNERLVTKVHFPRLALPLAAALAVLPDAVVLLLAGMAAALAGGWRPGLPALLLPVVLASAALAALGPGLWLAALNVRYRDVRYALPFAIQLGLLLSPVAYPLARVSEAWRLLYAANPVVGVLELWRWSVSGAAPDLAAVGVSATSLLLLLIGGAFFFRRIERSFADVL